MGRFNDFRGNMADFGREMAKSRREIAEKRKNEFLHTRVSETLKEKVKLRSKEIGVPSSILIRNILEAYFNLPETIQTKFNNFEVKFSDKISDISGWQKFVPFKTQSCSSCGRGIKKGEKAFRGVKENGDFLDIHCDVCVSEFLA